MLTRGGSECRGAGSKRRAAGGAKGRAAAGRSKRRARGAKGGGCAKGATRRRGRRARVALAAVLRVGRHGVHDERSCTLCTGPLATGPLMLDCWKAFRPEPGCFVNQTHRVVLKAQLLHALVGVLGHAGDAVEEHHCTWDSRWSRHRRSAGWRSVGGQRWVGGRVSGWAAVGTLAAVDQ